MYTVDYLVVVMPSNYVIAQTDFLYYILPLYNYCKYSQY
jgi:hypothetical protein